VSSNKLHQGAKIADGDAREEFFQWVEHLEHDIFGLPRPDMTIYLDIPPEDSQKLLEYIEDVGATDSESRRKRSSPSGQSIKVCELPRKHRESVADVTVCN
jgi:thymidylate kinase